MNAATKDLCAQLQSLCCSNATEHEQKLQAAPCSKILGPMHFVIEASAEWRTSPCE